jgi:hypothetical protein
MSLCTPKYSYLSVRIPEYHNLSYLRGRINTRVIAPTTPRARFSGEELVPLERRGERTFYGRYPGLAATVHLIGAEAPAVLNDRVVALVRSLRVTRGRKLQVDSIVVEMS